MKKASLLLILSLFFVPVTAASQSPDDSFFDLRDYYADGTTDYTTSVRSQSWGTCWIFGTYAALESNLTMFRTWLAAGMEGEADLAEYHLDKFNGFNRKGEPDDEPDDSWYTGQKDPFPGSNYDESPVARTHGLTVHLGGDYRISAAYLTNYGAVNETTETRVSGDYPAKRIDFGYGDEDGIPKVSEEYRFFIPHDIEWLTLSGSDAEKRRRIKEAVADYGAVATCIYYGGGFFINGSHYQPSEDSRDPNHSIAIVGWDDNQETQAEENGAWLCRNSWGSGWNGDGHFWVSYADKHAARHPEMGGVSFRTVQENTFNCIHSHSLHGWQYDTGDDPLNITGAANHFVADENQVLLAVGFYSMAENVNYSLRVLDTLSNEGLELAQLDGSIERPGFHLVEFDRALFLPLDKDFFITLELDHGGYAFDASFKVYTAMGMKIAAESKPGIDPYEDFYKFDSASDFYLSQGTVTDPPYDVYSKALAGESFYRDAVGQWRDFLDYDAYNAFQTEWNDQSWNFTINAYAVTIADSTPGDCDSDQDVDGLDLALWAAAFDHPDCGEGSFCVADFDQDGDVDMIDLLVLAANFGNWRSTEF